MPRRSAVRAAESPKTRKIDVASSALEDLNDPQREAVEATEGPVLVVAGAGSGKTRVITHRIAHLIQDRSVPAWQIFAATFTNKAAREMQDRVYDLLDAPAQARLSIATFHSLCARLLRRQAEKAGLTSRFTILDEVDQKAVVKACMKRLEIDPKYLSPAQALERIGQAKIRLMGPEDAGELFAGSRGDEYLEIYRNYERTLSSNDAVDFDDLLLKVVRLFVHDPETLEAYRDRYRYILVDEYQDTNLVQFRLVELLAGQSRNLCVVGDEDQSIYSWRGAEIGNLLNFDKAFPETRLIRLEQNYRSTKTILAAADAVIRRNTERLGKTLWTDGEQGDPVVVVEAASGQGEAAFVAEEIRTLNRAEGIPYGEIGVFYRVNALSRVFEEQLRSEDIPYRVVGGVRFFDRLEVKDVLAYLQVTACPASGMALARIINRPRRGVGEKTLRKLEGFALERGLPLTATLTDEEALAQIGAKARKSLGVLAGMFGKWRGKIDKVPLAALAEEIIEDVGYLESFGDPESLEAITRTQNVEEVLVSMREFGKTAETRTLIDYLEHVALTSSADEGEEGEERVSLMTLHSAKGLEFRAVFIVGLEDNIFPNPRAIEEQQSAEEERRLFYVGITRAKERLHVSHARERTLYGRPDWQTPSSFLSELPDELTTGRNVSDERRVDRLLFGASPRRRRSRRPSPRPTESLAPRFAPGQRVEHEFLGAGQIVAITGVGTDRKLVIRLEDGETAEVLERYGELKGVEPF
jgi:DNA helicase-2/ATP-dependent DNA helicase PcrA